MRRYKLHANAPNDLTRYDFDAVNVFCIFPRSGADGAVVITRILILTSLPLHSIRLSRVKRVISVHVDRYGRN